MGNGEVVPDAADVFAASTASGPSDIDKLKLEIERLKLERDLCTLTEDANWTESTNGRHGNNNTKRR